MKKQSSQSAALPAAAKTFDSMVKGTDKGDPKAIFANLSKGTFDCFDVLTKLAKKEPAPTTAKLGKLVDDARKDAVRTINDEHADYVKVAESRDRAVVKELEEHTALTKRGLKEVTEHRDEAKKVLAQVKANRTKGEAGIIDSRKLLYNLRIDESTVANKGAFHKSQTPTGQLSKAMDSAFQAKADVAKMYKADEVISHQAKVIMDESRDIRDQVVKEIAAHEEILEKEAALAAKDEGNQTKLLKKLNDEFDKLEVEAKKTLPKLERPAWEEIKELTESNAEKPYQELLEETEEAFETFADMSATLKRISKQATNVDEEPANKEIEDVVDKLLVEIGRLRVKFRTPLANIDPFKKLVTECDAAWKKRGRGA